MQPSRLRDISLGRLGRQIPGRIVHKEIEISFAILSFNELEGFLLIAECSERDILAIGRDSANSPRSTRLELLEKRYRFLTITLHFLPSSLRVSQVMPYPTPSD